MIITINSEPSGALIYLDNKVLGSAPLEHVVLLSSKGKSQGYERLNVYAVWPSGARSETGANVPLNAGGNQKITFARSSNASGLNIDLSHEAKIREGRAKATQDGLNAKTNGN
ncbi:PEGA domain-containing protein [Hydrogenophaga sp.]|uniref:PEGA domain-containing protein n=1 Tax=Hydrogenophaga sp. TaxID=1904254 RepID=UPI002734D4B9|nr:PEGA domain-containing protein [Hydrogenophaga sp.]MDP3887917.1 PEGA domain-containing protein [Hydrogenophaga sp.]